MTNTIGFDLYFHALSVVSLDSISTLNFSVNLGFGEMPRYILFHYLLYVGSLLFIPPIITISMLNAIPVFLIVNSRKMCHPVYFCFSYILILVSIVYWSVAATVILLFFYFMYGGRHQVNGFFLFLALSLHYISIPLSFIYFLFFKEVRIKILLMTVLVFVCAIAIYTPPHGLCSFQSSSTYDIFNYENIITRVSYKLKELALLLVSIIAIFKLENKVKLFKKNVDISFVAIVGMLFSVLCVILLSFSNQQSDGKIGMYTYIQGDMLETDKLLMDFTWLNINDHINTCRVMNERL
ncbi:hypothetical protein J4G65_21400 [Aeromonas allosaccharophila]|uniref:hypothetical protein n=1 Tax=Aeromonas allosaccharophila TaxID=656 RepID=UPI001BCFA2AB|nr:hypothetical protein [Aeromonas allosaccharophila]MBS4698001.1 hypothetical protein [Aeromonas allosaccharophila]